MTSLDTVDLLLIAAAERGEFEYRHTFAAADHMYLWNGTDVDVETMKRLSVLIDHRYLHITAIHLDSPVRVTPAGLESLQMVPLDGVHQLGAPGTHTPVASQQDTTTATVYRSPRHPSQPWALGLGFDDHLASLMPGQDAPLDAADAALAEAGLRRLGDWRPHVPRASWGWRTATVTKESAR